MLLCLDVGNTNVFGGVFDHDRMILRFRYATHLIGTADQFGIFLSNILHTHHLTTRDILRTAVCSVVPSVNYTIQHAMTLYFHTHYFMLDAQLTLPLDSLFVYPPTLGSDRLANALGAIHAYPQQNIIIIDMGTATTVCAISSHPAYMGGVILPGIRLSMESLKLRTAQLPEVPIVNPTAYLGTTTQANIQAGLYYGQLGALKEIITGVKQEAFPKAPAMIIGTGGFAQLYREKQLFDVILPDLTLHGLCQASKDAQSA